MYGMLPEREYSEKKKIHVDLFGMLLTHLPYIETAKACEGKST